MNEFIDQFMPYISKDICWNIDINAIDGLKNEEIDVYTEKLNIEAKGDFRLWLQTFGKCSGGLFMDDFFVFNKYNNRSDETTLLVHMIINLGWQQELVDEGFITQKDLDGKPYFFSRLNETSYYFIYTTDPELQVWHYCDGDDTFECTGFSFIEYLKNYLSGIKCSKGIWLNKSDVLRISTSDLF
ncbi:hypothetical protein [Psychrobacter fozii]|uniref:hypothetical protein n=1 Tax=Psychrobacter fozii TaxID=198480 RepID=UPI001919C11D|nr:hypothetical protein [Psychrobacter fozii]